MVFDVLIVPAQILSSLELLPDMTRQSARLLLDPLDKQDVPKAVTLIQKLKTLSTLEMPTNPSAAAHHRGLTLLADVIGYFTFPFIMVEMSLS
jgi:hypothetical protein